MRRADIGFLEDLNGDAPGVIAVADAMGVTVEELLSFARTQLYGGTASIDDRADDGMMDLLSARCLPSTWGTRIVDSLRDLNLMALWHDLSGHSAANITAGCLDSGVRGLAVIVSDDLFHMRDVETSLVSSDIVVLRVGVPENSVPPTPGEGIRAAGMEARVEMGEDLFGAIDAINAMAADMGVRLGDVPAVVVIDEPPLAPGLIAMGMTVACDSGLGMGPFVSGLTGGEVIHTSQVHEAIEQRRARCGLDRVTTHGSLGLGTLVSMAGEGAEACIDVAQAALEHAGPDVSYATTAYGVPTVHAFHGAVTSPDCLNDILESYRGSDSPDGIGVAAMLACDVIESLGDREGFVPDSVLRELGVSLVDDTIPAIAAIIGSASDPEALRTMVRTCQSKGFLILVADDIGDQLRAQGVNVSPEVRVIELGRGTAVVHALNLAVRAALSFGNVTSGDVDSLVEYLHRRLKVVVTHLGPLDAVHAALGLAVVAVGGLVLTDMDVEGIDGSLATVPVGEMVQTAVEELGIVDTGEPVDIPVPFGPAFEGEVIRKGRMHFQAGGGQSPAFEVLRTSDDVEDGKVELIGPDVGAIEEGSTVPLGIFVSVYGRRMREDFEPVIERRIHQFVNYAEGAWHTGQRDMIWVRMSREGVAAGLRLLHLGEVLVHKLKEEFSEIVSRVQVTIVTDAEELEARRPWAEEAYARRDERMTGLRDATVDTFYTCTLCQSFAPDHVCIVTPERLGLCGAINWLDAQASAEISPNGPNRPVSKGEPIDEGLGEWEGVNDAVSEFSNGHVGRMCLYSLMEAPMTACGCFEAIVAMTADMQGVVIADRDFPGMTPVGMTFSTLAGSIGGGRQTPGFIGIGRRYLVSERFISADGGFLRIAWMPLSLKRLMADDLRKRAEALDVPDFMDRVADETTVTTADELMTWMVEHDHPALGMEPLLH